MNDKVQGGFPPEAFDGLATQEDSNWWFRSRNKIIIWAIKKYTSNPETFLEIGCGTGFVLQAIRKTFPFTTLHGDEYFEEGLQYAKIRVPDASFRKLDATKMEDRDCYDAIGAFDVVEHIEDDNTALKNCFQALKKDGHLFLTVPQHMWLWSQVDEDACHVRRYTQSELKFKVEQSGFHVLTSASFISFLVPLMFLSRKSLLKKTLAPRSELKIPGWLNFLFELVMQVEIYFIKIGFRIPFGGSLIFGSKKTVINFDQPGLDNKDVIDIQESITLKGYHLIKEFIPAEICSSARDEYFQSMHALELNSQTKSFQPTDLLKNAWRKTAVGSRNGLGEKYSQVLQTTYMPLKNLEEFQGLNYCFNQATQTRNQLTDMPKNFGSENSLQPGTYWNASRIHHYPSGGGHMAEHKDTHFPAILGKSNIPFIQVAILLSNRNIDFSSGGGFIVDRDGQKIFFEDESSIGSMVIFDGSLKHGVEDIDPHLILDWQSSKGRIALFSNLYIFR